MRYESAIYVWTPPPAAAYYALEQLRIARSKRHESLHVLIVPKLFYGLFRRQLFKQMDIVSFIPTRFAIWCQKMHQPLILALLFLFLRHCPIFIIPFQEKNNFKSIIPKSFSKITVIQILSV